MTFDTLLEDDEHLTEMDYISLFINNEDVKRKDFSPIEKYIQKTYQKDTYSYTTEELHKSGAYGKEDLNQEGVYLYITKVNETDEHMVVNGEKYYTVKTLQPSGMEITFTEMDEGWSLEDAIVEWEGSPS